MNPGLILPMLVLLPLMMAGLSMIFRKPYTIIRFGAAGTVAASLLALFTAWKVLAQGPIHAMGPWFFMDALSAYHLIVMTTTFSISSLFGIRYFTEESAKGHFDKQTARRYSGLWFGSMAAMLLVLTSNNLAIMWVGIEATTLLTAFLICTKKSEASLEAMWKYLLMCSVGVAIAFTGILLAAASTSSTGLNGSDAMMWTALSQAATRLNPVLMKVSFIFIVVGYGTKSGLAPMHNWLPDAHSQAPAPVSAVFSGFLLNAALYCILRFLPIVEAATGNADWGHSILLVLGLLSVGVAAALIARQTDAKRLLAYSSVEHIGIIAAGIGLGPAGTFAAMLHMFNHSLAKTLMFCTVGRIGQVLGTYEIKRISGLLRLAPAWSIALLAGLLTLVGAAPLALFLSEFLILKTAIENSHLIAAALLIAGLAIVFVVMLRHAISIIWGSAEEPGRQIPSPTRVELLIICASITVLLILGLWIPAPLADILSQATSIIGSTP